MKSPVTGGPLDWHRFEPLLERCSSAELVSAVVFDTAAFNIFSLMTFRRGPSAPTHPTSSFVTAKPYTVPRTQYRLAIKRTTMPISDARNVVPVHDHFVEPDGARIVQCPGLWAEPQFVGNETHRLRSVVPDLDGQFWILQRARDARQIEELVGAQGMPWLTEKICQHLTVDLDARTGCIGGFIIALPEYRGQIRVERGTQGRLGIEFRGDRQALRPVVHVRANRSDEFCKGTVLELTERLTVLESGTSDFEEVELYDLNSGMLIDRHAGTPFRGAGLTMHVGEPIDFAVTLHDAGGAPAGAPLQIKTHWGRIQQTEIDERSEWERLQRRAAVLAEQGRLCREGRLFFYSGDAGDREKAIRHLRGLIQQHTKTRLWIWDPYFGGFDVLNFLPYVADPATTVRVLTSLTAASTAAAADSEAQLKEAVAALAEPRGRGPGMTGISVRRGTGFHDRFLITDVSCWQLGTSFNHIGSTYSTLVEFPHVEVVQQAFEHEWHRAQPLVGSS